MGVSRRGKQKACLAPGILNLDVIKLPFRIIDQPMVLFLPRPGQSPNECQIIIQMKVPRLPFQNDERTVMVWGSNGR